MKKQKKIMILLIILVCLGIQTCYAKYQSYISGKIVGRIAEPIITIKSENSLLVTAIEPKQQYHFSISNYNENKKINEVQMKYYIEFIYNEANVNLELYKENEKIEIKDKKTKENILGIEQKEENNYIVKISYKETEEIKKDILEEIEIKIHSVQGK